MNPKHITKEELLKILKSDKVIKREIKRIIEEYLQEIEDRDFYNHEGDRHYG